MTKAQFRKKVRELHRKDKEIFDACVENFLTSECVKLSDYEDNYILPGLFMYAFSKEQCWLWKPPTKGSTKTANIIARII